MRAKKVQDRACGVAAWSLPVSVSPSCCDGSMTDSVASSSWGGVVREGPRPPVPGEIHERLAVLLGELKAFSAIDVLAAGPDELAELNIGLARAESMVAAQAARAADALRTSAVVAASGYRSPRMWLADQTGASPVSCGRRLRLGRVMREVPEAGAAFEAGEIGGDHLHRLAAARNPRTAPQMAVDGSQLVGWAKELSFAEFDRLLAYWSRLADPDGAERSAADDHAARSAYLVETISGMWAGQQTFDPVTGAIVARELERLERKLFNDDRAAARQRLGRDPTSDELGRTPGQRRADAFAEMARRSAEMHPDARLPRVLFSVLVGQGTFAELCEIETTRHPIPPGALAGWLGEAVFERVLFDGPDRVLGISAQRGFTGALRRALEVRDRGCAELGCTVAAHLCHGDHVFPAERGGPTSEANGQLECDVHNARKGTRPGQRRHIDHDRYLRWLTNDPDPPDPPDPPGTPETPDTPGPDPP